MTCIIGIKDKENGCVYMGADSLASTWLNKILIKNKKIFKAKDNKNILMAVCGSASMINFLSVEENLVEEVKELKNEVNLEHIIKYTVPKIFTLAEKYNCCEIINSCKKIVGNILFAYKDQLYIIEECGAVLEPLDDYLANGSGFMHAYGVLSVNSNKPIVERIRDALEAAEKHGRAIERPFYIMNTKNDDVVEVK